MARTEVPSLSDGNKLYLYDLLKREIGVGRQTFLPRVEEALARDRMTGADLGFEGTRALMEALAEVVSLTVFKGGRVYATVQPMPDWDEALAAADAPKTPGGNGKPWKRKRGAKAKALKPQRPRRVKREEPAVEDGAFAGARGGEAETRQKTAREAMPVDGGLPAAKPGAVVANGTDGDSGTRASEVAGRESVVFGAVATGDVATKNEASSETPELPDEQGEPIADEQASPASDEPVEEAAAQDDENAAAPAPETPSISLTITYDPTSGKIGETTLVAEGTMERDGDAASGDAAAIATEDAAPSRPAMPHEDHPIAAPVSREAGRTPTPTTPHRAAAETREGAAERRSASAPASETAPPSVSSSGTFPHAAIVTEEHAERHAPRPVCPDTVPTKQALASYPRDFTTEVHIPGPLLSALTQIMPLHANVADELSRDFRAARGLGEVRGTRARAVFPLRFDGGNRAVAVAIKRTPQAARPWAVNFIDRIEETALAEVDVEGLPLLSPAEDAIRALAERSYLDPVALGRLVRAAWPAIWDTDALRAQLAFALRDAELNTGSFPTGLYTATGAPLLAVFEATGEDIPWRLVGPEQS
ncbi:MAG: hypothetical protein E7001_00885 [Coriobacteriaceae bacterium]|nr:hypothetical protein [Coriobacteriaceae bacterium]